MENQTTVKDILIDVTKLLNEINIPISLVENIGIPVARAISGIQMCLDAFERNSANQAAQDDGFEIENIETGAVSEEEMTAAENGDGDA